MLYKAGEELTFTADVEVEGTISTDFKLTSSVARVAAVSGKTVTLGNSAGQAIITATAVGDSTKTHALTLNTGYTVTVSGGTADVTIAYPNQVVTLTPQIPAGKLFIDWANASNLQMLTVNTFSMPGRNVSFTINLGEDKPYYITNNFGEDSSTDFLVQWHSFTSDTQTFQYVTGTGDFTGATEITVQGKKFEAVSPIGAFSPRHVFRVHLENLTPGTTYKYRVGSTGNWSEEFQHTTSLGTDADFSFTVVADPQSDAHTDMAKTLRAADAFDPNHKFYLFGGDLVDEMGRRPAEIVSYTETANEFNKKRPLAATQGNHDTYHSTDSGYRFGEATIFNRFVTFPDNGGDTQDEKENRSQCYYFYYNKVLFIVLNTLATTTGVTTSNPDWTRQIKWLQDVLKKDRDENLSRYTIVFTHISPFGGQQNNRWLNPETLKAFGKVFTDNKVDIVFSGHDHVYGRSNPMKISATEMVGTVTDLQNMDTAGDFDVPGGTVFSIVGATGPKFYTIVESDVWIPKYYPIRSDKITPGMFVNVKVTADKLTVTAKITGKADVLDTYEVELKAK
jgi:predicted phosphodiesterase